MLEINKNYNPDLRDDDLHIYKARIYKNMKVQDDRIQVRLLPFMADIPDKECSMLPKFPPFRLGHVIRGYTEVDDGADKASIVYVVCNKTFNFGYVLDLVNNFEGCAKQAMSASWKFQKVKSILTRANALPSSFEYANINVDVINPAGTLMMFHDFKNGNFFLMDCYGDTFTMQNKKIYMCARAGVESGANMSSVSITPERVDINTQIFNVNAKQYLFGKHAMHVLGTNSISAVMYNGMNLTPLTNMNA